MKKFYLKTLKQNICCRIKDPAGLSIVEVIVSLALFAIVAVFICDTLLFSISLIARAKDTTKSSFQTAANVIQKTIDSSTSSFSSDTTVNTSSGNLTITFNDGTTMTVSGSYINGSTSSQPYTTFAPN